MIVFGLLERRELGSMRYCPVVCDISGSNACCCWPSAGKKAHEKAALGVPLAASGIENKFSKPDLGVQKASSLRKARRESSQGCRAAAGPDKYRMQSGGVFLKRSNSATTSCDHCLLPAFVNFPKARCSPAATRDADAQTPARTPCRTVLGNH